VSEFKREHRYFVFKISDAEHAPAMPEHVLDDLSDIGQAFDRGRAARNKLPLECVVVESDWPEYEIVWGMLEARIEGRPNQITALQARIAELEAALTEIDGCFEAALFEGWIEALADGDMDRIRDIYGRRINYIRGIIVQAAEKAKRENVDE